MSGKVLKIREIGSRPRRSSRARKIQVRTSQNFVATLTGIVGLLVGLVVGASLVAIPVAATAYAVSSAWDNQDFMSVKNQEVPGSKTPPKQKRSSVITPLN